MHTQGLESLEDYADARQTLAIQGRYGDTTIGHLTPGEMVLPRPLADDPVLKRQLFDAFERHELNPYQYQVGHFENSINPLTGVPEFGFFKKIGKFLKKAAPVIGQIIGYAYGGPMGSAIGGGIGGAVKEGDMGGAIKGAAQGYVGGNIAKGAGITGGGGIASMWGQGSPGAESMWTFGANPTQETGIGALYQNVGANLADFVAPGQTNLPAGTTIPKIGDQWEKMGTFQKMGAGAAGLAALGGFEAGKDESKMPGPSGELGGYLQNPLTPAAMPGQYGTPGTSVSPMSNFAGITNPYSGIPSSTQQQIEEAMRDKDYSELMFPEFQRVGLKDGGRTQEETQQQIEEAMRDKDYSELMFPEFQRVGFKGGGRIYDGTPIPELDLRKTGGGVSDPQGSGDEDTIDAKLADGEFVMTKQAVKGIGNGNHSKGIKTLYAAMNMNEDKAAMMGLGRA